MKIICPLCLFTRQVPEEKIPATSVMATCPQCQHRFKIERPMGDMAQTSQVQTPPQAQTSQAQDISAQPIPKYVPNPEAFDTLKEKEKQKAAAAYEKQEEQSAQEQEDAFFADFAIENPWEHAEQIGYFSAFYQTVMRVLFAAPRFFAGLIPTETYYRAIIFYCIVCILQITFERFWGGVLGQTLAPMAEGDAQLQMVISMLDPKSSYVLALLLGTALNLAELFFSAAFFYVLFRFVAPQRADFNVLLQVVAYSSAPVLLCVVPALGSVVGFVWAIACTAVGCRYAMRTSWGQTLLCVFPLYMLGLGLAVQFLFRV